MHKLRVLLIAAFLILPCVVNAAPDIQKTTLDNGLTVLITPMASTETVSIYAYVNTGGATEGRFLGTGISHFIEHMLFKGTKRRKVGEIAKEVKAIGGTINASTDLDYTMYTLDVPKEKLQQGIDILSDMLQHSVFDAEEVEKERNVIHGEMRLYYDRPQRRLSVNTFKNVFIQHPYQHTTIGYENLFDSITRNDLYGYYKRQYIPNNMIVSIAGGLDPDVTLDLVKRQFKNFKPRPYTQRNIVAEPPQIAPRYSEEYYETPFFWFSLAYQGIPLLDPDVYAMDVLSLALGSGAGSRLYKEIYEDKKLVSQISAMNYTPYDKGVFEIEGMMEVDNLEKVKSATLKIIEDIKRRGLNPDELTKVKNQNAARLIYDNQTSSSIAYRAAVDQAMTGDYRFSERYVGMVRRVSNDDIKRVARKYLIDTTLNVTVIKPLKSKPAKAAKEEAAGKNNIESVILPNGITLLLKEDRSAALVSVQMALNGGLRSETEANNGIASLMTGVWTKATTHQSQDKITKELELRAASLGAYSGYNALGVGMQFLSQDTDFGLRLLADAIKNPVFEADAIALRRKELAVAIDGRDDDIRSVTIRRAVELLYDKPPYHMDILGNKDIVSKLSAKDLMAYYKQMVVPNNMVIAVFGDIDKQKVRAFFEQEFKDLKPQEIKLAANESTPITTQRTDRLTKDKEQAVVAMMFAAPKFKDTDRFAMEVVNATLGSGLSGRLFNKVRDQLGKAYTVGSSYSPGVDMGNIVLFCLTTNAKVDSVKDIITKEIADLSQQLISDEELANAKSHLKGSNQRSLATIGSQATRSAFNALYGLGYDFEDHYNASIDKVSKEDVKAAVVKYLDPSKAVIVTTLGSRSQ